MSSLADDLQRDINKYMSYLIKSLDALNLPPEHKKGYRCKILSAGNNLIEIINHRFNKHGYKIRVNLSKERLANVKAKQDRPTQEE